MLDITLGQYFPGDSVLHRMDPRIKLVLTFAYIVAIFIPNNWIGLGIAVLFLMFTIIVSKLPASLIIKSVKPIIPIVIFTSILNIFYTKTGDTLFQWKFIQITTGGIITAIFITIRITALILGSSLLTHTTTPTALTDGLEKILSPLEVFRLDVHELAMMMTIALRFIPTLIEETDKIMAAQKARGADLESGNLIQRIKALIPILVPLFISSFQRAYELATAMECRCYRGGEGRTRMKQLKTQSFDWIAFSMMILLIGVLIVTNFFIPKVV